MRDYGKLAHEWTNQEIHPETREYLGSLPHSFKEENMCFVHGSPHSNHEYLLPDLYGSEDVIMAPPG